MFCDADFLEEAMLTVETLRLEWPTVKPDIDDLDPSTASQLASMILQLICQYQELLIASVTKAENSEDTREQDRVDELFERSGQIQDLVEVYLQSGSLKEVLEVFEHTELDLYCHS